LQSRPVVNCGAKFLLGKPADGIPVSRVLPVHGSDGTGDRPWIWTAQLRHTTNEIERKCRGNYKESEPPGRRNLQRKKGRNQQDCEPNSCCEAERSHDQAEKDRRSG